MIEEKLQYILDLVNYWLKFAEAKNGTLIALIGASLVGLFQILSQSDFDAVIEVYLVNYLLFGSFALLISLISFIPKIELPAFLQNQDINKKHNLYFYGHLKNHSIESLLNKLFDDQENFNKRQRNLAEQIIINSEITYHKYEFFKIAIFLLICGLITPLLFAIAVLYFRVFFNRLF